MRKGRGLAQQVAPRGVPDAGSNTPMVTHASDLSLSGEDAAGSRRWVVDSGSCIDMVSEGSVTKKERKSVEEMGTPMRLNTASGEVTA